MKRNKPDIRIEDQGSLVLFRLLTPAAKNWADEHCPEAQYFGGALVVEPRYVSDLIDNAQNDGMILEA